MKQKFYIEFNGFCTIEAESQREAENKFWDNINTIAFKDIHDDVYGIKVIEEIEKR